MKTIFPVMSFYNLCCATYSFCLKNKEKKNNGKKEKITRVRKIKKERES
jgi:hypothetical protein